MQHASFTEPSSSAVHTVNTHAHAEMPSGDVKTIDVTPEDLQQMIIYLRKAKQRANAIRERAPAGSYLENVLARTIDGISLELAQLDYLLAGKADRTAASGTAASRMRPAL